MELLSGFDSLAVFAVAVFSGAVAAVLGLGGGIILVPALTLLLGIPFSEAAGASIVAVAATSNGASLQFKKNGFAHEGLALWLELGTVLGAAAGVVSLAWIAPQILYLLFGCALLLASWNMLTGRRDLSELDAASKKAWPRAMRLDAEAFQIKRPLLGVGTSFFAGAISSMLGVGGGVVKVPVMNALMAVPLRVAVATSSLMIGMTAATGALMYFVQGKLNMAVVAPIVAGALVGSMLSMKAFHKVNPLLLRKAFALVAVVVALRMFWGAWG